ncbi:YchJ family protein [Aquimarina mytili]|uniref:Sec-C motif domain protein n=1 Tax=Aquimarina mytili TaxID=874423 RepID=A0A937A1S1_9FLAO|nr:YchJ family metal-binding protein [Aquimarina mytili]MBL0682834.1 Sec-C motif domain protein [Aquimarina mytili]
MTSCYCGRAISYASCCGKIHEDITSVATAEDLMRSRYSAFVLAKGDYLQKSHHSTTRPSSKEKKSIVCWAKSVQWVKLEVLHTSEGMPKDTKGTVAFKAFYYEQGALQVIHEHSMFTKEHGYWVYVGEVQ